MPTNLTDRVVVITGASAGIGAAIARECAAAGMDLVLNARRADKLAEVAAAVRGLGRRAEVLAEDCAAPGAAGRLLDAAERAFGRCDVVISNAGYGFYQAVHESSLDDWRRIFEVNFFASVDLLREAARRWVAASRRGGHLMMTSSAVAKFTLEDFSAYSATKAAQNHVCRAMRIELRRHGIEVASIHPITTATDFFEVAADGTRARNSPAIRRREPAAWMIQKPELVARKVVACLRRPRPEVWTGVGPRFLAALLTMFPSLQDRAGRMRLPE